jgi:hypothetical protein
VATSSRDQTLGSDAVTQGTTCIHFQFCHSLVYPYNNTLYMSHYNVSSNYRMIGTWQIEEVLRCNVRIYLQSEEKLCKALVNIVTLQAKIWTCKLQNRKRESYWLDCGISGRKQLTYNLTTHTKTSEVKIYLWQVKLTTCNTVHCPSLHKKVDSTYFEAEKHTTKSWVL